MSRPSGVLLAAALALPACGAGAQAVPWSQHGSVTQRVGFTEIEISYNRPVARGRVLFGALVPWRQVWHPGADSATTLRLSRDLELEGSVVPAGRYTLWTIPDTTRWTVILSRAVDVYHRPYPGDSLDLLRVTVTPEQGAHMETMAFYFPVVAPDSAVLRLHWGATIVPLRFRVR